MQLTQSSLSKCLDCLIFYIKSRSISFMSILLRKTTSQFLMQEIMEEKAIKPQKTQSFFTWFSTAVSLIVIQADYCSL